MESSWRLNCARYGVPSEYPWPVGIKEYVQLLARLVTPLPGPGLGYKWVAKITGASGTYAALGRESVLNYVADFVTIPTVGHFPYGRVVFPD